MDIGTCKYCLKEKPLVVSHLLPRALYRRLGEQRIVSTPEEVKRDTFQLKAPLLCEPCDSSLSANGENWMIPLLARRDGAFPLYDLLRKVPPDFTQANEATYAAVRNTEIDVKRLAHFATAIFWKASVHSWQRRRAEILISLGPYGEEIRKVLRGGALFPKNVALTVAVLPPPVKQISFYPPFLTERSGFHTYSLYVLGILFALSVGKRIGNVKESCFFSNPTHPITVCDFSDDLERARQRFIKEARISRQVLRIR
jgi:hypothetical protein